MKDDATTFGYIGRALSRRGYSIDIKTLGSKKRKYAHIKNEQGKYVLILSVDGPLYPFPSASSRVVCANKDMTYEVMAGLGLSTPRSLLVPAEENDYRFSIDFMHSCGRVVVKPVKASLSEGLSLDITSEVELVRAIEHARSFHPDVLVQKQFFGEEVRFAVCEGRVAAAILRQTPQVIGNGKNTVRELVDVENAKRRNIQNSAVEYPILEKSMLLEGIDFKCVPNDGEIVKLGRGTMVKNGASIYDITKKIHQSYIDIAELAGGALGRGFVVVDMMIENYLEPATKDNYVFLECNLAPALRLFYSCRDGLHFDVAEKYLAPMLDKAIKG